jgi:hypothetical protein
VRGMRKQRVKSPSDRYCVILAKLCLARRIRGGRGGPFRAVDAHRSAAAITIMVLEDMQNMAWRCRAAVARGRDGTIFVAYSKVLYSRAKHGAAYLCPSPWHILLKLIERSGGEYVHGVNSAGNTSLRNRRS